MKSMATLHIAKDALRAIEDLPQKESARIYSHLDALEDNEVMGLVIKTLRGKVQELVVRQYRVVFFRIDGDIHVRAVFKKQSRKTPRHIIEKASKDYQAFKYEKSKT